MNYGGVNYNVYAARRVRILTIGECRRALLSHRCAPRADVVKLRLFAV